MIGGRATPVFWVLLLSLRTQVALSTCPDDPDVDLCDDDGASVSAATRRSGATALAPVLLALTLGGAGAKTSALALMLLAPLAVQATGNTGSSGVGHTCGAMKQVYKDAGCCGQPTHASGFQVVPAHAVMAGTNVCNNKKPVDSAVNSAGVGNGYFNNINCTTAAGVRQALEQAGANVTVGYTGLIDTGSRVPITTSYLAAGLCPVNVHWHLGTEHLSVGQYDEGGSGPSGDGHGHRRLSDARPGFRCHHYNSADTKFTSAYAWQHCLDMHVGETYEVHWPHSAAGACGTPNQYQSPFYDGVFCTDGIITLDPLNTYTKIGVQSQVFTIVNDEAYYYPDLMRGMIVEGQYGADVAKYTGSTTGTSRNNQMCSRFTPITWQVDRKCHLISASSFDKMCADMKSQRDDMSSDLHAHGSRELVSDFMAANNMVR